MKKLLILTILIFLTGCQGQDFGNGVIQKEFIVGGERVLVGGEMVLGGFDLVDFKPEVILQKWGDETYLKVWSEETGDKTATEVNDKVIWHTDDKEFNFYTLPPADMMEDGGFEFEIILKEKPKSNVITLKIETQNLAFYYQPPLSEAKFDKVDGVVKATETQAFDKDGNIVIYRPENVVGSYAVYHSTKRNNIVGGTEYKAGKAFHIFRPQLEDAKGWKVWADLHIENGIMSVTIPQDFLDKAKYPIKHAVGATFGYSSVPGTSQTFIINGRILGSKLNTTASLTGSVDSVSAYMNSGSANVKGLMYDTNGALLTNGATGGVSAPGSKTLTTMTYSTKPSVTNGNTYYPAIIADNSLTTYYDDGAPTNAGFYDIANNYTSPESVDPGSDSSNKEYGVYATYSTASAPPAGDAKHDIIFFK